jgi:hypothetical protein
MSPSPLRATLSFLLAAGVFAGGLSLLLPGEKEVAAADFFLETQEVSVSAPLRIALPAGFENATAEISPALAGSWEKEGEELLFQPAEKFPLGKVFFAEVAAGKKSFRVELETVEDPRVVAVFPEGKEVAADGGVTVLFNRALAPLASFEKGILPAERAPILSPRIAGSWRWLSTRALRFSPAAGRLPLSEVLRSASIGDFVGDLKKKKDVGWQIAIATRRPAELRSVLEERKIDFSEGDSRAEAFGI